MLLATIAQAQLTTNVYVGSSFGDYNTLSNWSEGNVPDATNLAVINGGNVVNVSGVVLPTTGLLRVANQNGVADGTTLNITTGGSLDVNGIQVSTGSDTGFINLSGGSLTNNGTENNLDIRSAGTFTISGGAYTDNRADGAGQIVTDGGGTLELTAGSFTAQGTAANEALTVRNAAINISGGTFDMTGGQVIFANSPVMTVSGDGATILIDRLNVNTAARAGTINFEFNATGISPIVNSQFTNLSELTINVDGSSYSGGAATFDLMTADNINVDFDPANLSVTGFGDEGVGWNWIADMDGIDGDSLAIQVVPEPATYAYLFGLLSIGLIFLKRRNSKE